MFNFAFDTVREKKMKKDEKKKKSEKPDYMKTLKATLTAENLTSINMVVYFFILIIAYFLSRDLLF